MELEKINGIEIIDFLNSLSDETEGLGDISTEYNSFVFDKQIMNGIEYKLEFSASFNNWGTSQDIHYNVLWIKDGKIKLGLNEPFDDGTAESLEKVLAEWLETHVFDTNPELLFNTTIGQARYDMDKVRYDIKPDELQAIIDKLERAKTYMK